MFQGLYYDEEELDDFLRRFKADKLQPDEKTTFQLWTEQGHPDPRDSVYSEMEYRILATKLFGESLLNKNQYYCFGNCRLGLQNRLLHDLKRHLSVIMTFICGAQSEFKLYDTDDLKMMMAEYELDPENPQELLFVKRLVASYYSGYSKAQSENQKRNHQKHDQQRTKAT
ncbi:MAG: hypothetical protein HQM11_07640 [SAR324 cluster bacterium]|nr:hypothetical protein [SAR324 cluster bacterium]